jgi:hypothetical protein
VRRLDGLGAQSSATALERTSFIFRQSAPDAGILASLERPRNTWFGYRATPADCLRLIDLEKGWAGVADWEEEFGVFVTASSAVAPVHVVHLLSSQRDSPALIYSWGHGGAGGSVVRIIRWFGSFGGSDHSVVRVVGRSPCVAMFGWARSASFGGALNMSAL